MDNNGRDEMRALVEAGIALTSELSLDGVLRKLVATAAELTGARYAALGVIDADRTGLERFVAHGLSYEEQAAIGAPPRGRGILGALIEEGRPLRLHDIAGDPRSVGFPPGHPPMRSFLGVPVQLRGVSYGNLYLTEKDGGADFTAEDEELVGLLAAQAAVAVENARLYEAATRWSAQLESLNEIAGALVGETDLDRQLRLVADRLRELIAARIVAVAIARPGGLLEIRTASGEELDGVELDAGSKSARVLARGRSERVDSLADDPEAPHPIGRRIGARAALYAPLVLRHRAIGVLIAFDKEGSDPRFGDADLRLAESFARRAATAVDLSQRVARDALRRAVAAQELERRRLARELHDETGQALTSILLGLRAVEQARSPEDVSQAVGAVRGLVVETLQDVRQLAVELRPKALDDFGLEPALKRLGQTVREQLGLDVQVEARVGDARLPAEIETAVYRIVQEAVTNVLKHADANHVSVVLTRKNASVSVVIEDDGRGFDPGEARRGGLGLLGMRERVELLDGSFEVESSPGHGTTLVFELPLP